MKILTGGTTPINYRRNMSIKRKDITTVKVREPEIIEHIKPMEPQIKYGTPNIFDIPQTEKEKFINEALYANDPRLLQVVINTVYRTQIGKEMINFINVLCEKNKIIFEPCAIKMNAYGRFSFNSPGICNDVLITIAKDNTIEFLASTLVHEISHFIDYYHAFNSEHDNFLHRFSTEALAFANSYRFLLEANLLNSYMFFLLSKNSKDLLITSYQYIYENEKYKSYDVKRLLKKYGYSGLDDKVEIERDNI